MKKKVTRIMLGVLLLILLGGIATWYAIFIWPVYHHRNLRAEQALSVKANELVAQFEHNEKRSDAQYLNKALEITGTITNLKFDQAGRRTVTLASDDPMSSVFCTLANKSDSLKVGTQVTLKGLCVGYLSDVVVIDAFVIAKP